MKIDNLKNYTPILIAIVSVAVSWGMMTQRINAQSDRLLNVEDRNAELNETLTQLRLDVAQIKADVGFIKNTLK